MSTSRRTILAAGAAALTLSLFAHASHAMPGYDDNMDDWPQKLKEVANPYQIKEKTDPAEIRLENRTLKTFEVMPEPKPNDFVPQANGFRQ